MSLVQFWKELVITQISTASVSLVASTAIVVFISKNGLSTPYRRLIFGLSISDICQSFAIVAGPWLTRADVLQALWGMGNKHTCRLDGFLFLVGMTAAPMYTLCLCIYYVFKLRWKMTDANFAHQVEKKMHAIIIVINACLYFTALGVDTINPAVNGTVCLAAAVPTGCRQNPEIFGECDERIGAAAQFFTIVSTFVVPLLCLFGDILCLAMIFWHVLAREKIFGGASKRRRTQQQAHHDSTSDGDGDGGDHSTNISPNDETAPGRRGQSQSVVVVDSSDLSSETGINDDDVSFLLKRIHRNHAGLTNTTPDSAPAPGGKISQSSSIDLESCPQDENEPKQNVNVNANANVFPISLSEDFTSTNTANTAELLLLDSQELRGVPPPGMRRSNRNRNRNHQQASTEQAARTAAERDLEAASRLYKKELLTQACCYVLIFCVSAMPFLIVSFILVSAAGTQPSRTMYRMSSLLFPLAGFFNIIVYTRPNVASLRRSRPQCSRIQAFWLVLRAGGEVPDVNDLNDTFFWNLGLGGCVRHVHAHVHVCRRRRGTKNRNMHADRVRSHPVVLENELEHGVPERKQQQQQQQQQDKEEAEEEEKESVVEPMPIKVAYIHSQETISDLRVGVASRPVVSSSLPPSNAGMNGMSMSLETGNPAYRATEDWHHHAASGGGGGKSASMRVSISIPEYDSGGGDADADADVDAEAPPSSSSELMPATYSELFSNNDDHDHPTASISSQHQQGGGDSGKKKEDKDDIWDAAFERARNLRFSQ